MRRVPRRSSRPSDLLAYGGLLALLVTQFAAVAPLNFYGTDDWTIHYLLSRWIIDIPYANRPLELLWELPARLVSPHSFVPYLVLYACYATLSSWLILHLCRRLLPKARTLGFLSASFFLVWAPWDFARLSHFERTMYTSFVFGLLLAFALFVESWIRRSEGLLAIGILVAFVDARSYEATIALLLAWPLFVAWAAGERSSRFLRWALAWEGFLVFALVLIVRPILFPSGSPSYQATIGMDADPARVLARLLEQFRLEIGPLFGSPWAELRRGGVALAVGVFSVVGGSLALLERRRAEAATFRVLAASALAGLALAILGFSVLVLTPAPSPPAWRMQFLSGPGIALLLAALICLLARASPRGLREAVALAGACFVVAVGTGRTLAMQSVWDSFSYSSRQRRMLTELTALAPSLEDHTLVVVVDQGGTWRSDWGFRHAVQYLYEEHAMGYVWNSLDLMFPTELTRQGVLCVPWPEVQDAWHAPPTLHRYDELVVVTNESGGALRLAERWPPALPALPPGARYDPRARISMSGGDLPERRLLHSGLWGRSP